MYRLSHGARLVAVGDDRVVQRTMGFDVSQYRTGCSGQCLQCADLIDHVGTQFVWFDINPTTAESGEIDATLLALAGMKRLGLAERATAILGIDDFLPAVGQGAIGITVREDDHAPRVKLSAVLDADTGYALAAERAFLEVLDGSCRTPIAGHATANGHELTLRGMVLRPDGSEVHEGEERGPVTEAREIGVRLGRRLLERLPPGFLP